MSIFFSLRPKRNIKKIQHEEILSGEGHQLLLEKRAKKLICPLDFFLLKKRLKNKFILSISFSLCAKRKIKKINLSPGFFSPEKKRLKNKFILSISFSLCAKRNVKQIQHGEILSGEGHQLLLRKGAKK